MYEKNQTWVSEIVLLGFQNLKNFKVPLFSLFLLIYIMTVCENVLIIVLVSSSRNLQSPMNSFLQQLALTDLLGSSNIVPTLLQTIIYDGVTVSLHSCIIVFNLFACSESMQCFLLAVMAYDRYVAICNPLRYTSIMNHRVCVRLILMSWALSIVITINTWSMIQTLRFCNETTIDHFFCDLTPLLELSCSNTFFVKLEITLHKVIIGITLPGYGCLVWHGLRK
ncbi:olfactory receptor 11L1-like [Xenopus tropicalis]|uniref:Olfactory receptor 11L1-like n=1 Tax=Xenopus tropicalis TaxID=8364 RepID=A0A8J1J8Q9_XENTR|nr:olfactory receptor 11L1-like [Xenopus tropicalis]